MIINSIRAQNVLKYAELSIDLADHGLIAISGHNESGKSSIGEAVCFALFGRTFSIPPKEIHKVVRWGENHCSVTLAFSVEDRHYLLSRFLDRDGNHSAKLAMADDPENPLARGVQPVADSLFAILGFEYDEFVESFYLAQREITAPHPHSHAVKIMAGVAPLEHVVNTLNNEIAEREELLGEIQAEWEAVDRDVRALDLKEGQLPGLEEQRQQTARQRDQVNTLVEQIGSGLQRCERDTTELQRARGARSRAAFLRFVFFLLAVAAGALWGLLNYAPELPQTQAVEQWLAQTVPQWRPERLIWVAYLAGGLAVLFLLLWVRVAGLNRRIRAIHEEFGQFATLLGDAREIEVEAVDAEPQAADTEQHRDDAMAGEEIDLEAPLSRPDQGEYETLCRQLELGDATVRLMRAYVERETAWLADVAGCLATQLDELDEEIDDEQNRLQEAMDLSEVLNGLTDKSEEVKERIASRQRGVELLAGAIAHLSNNFNRDVKDLVGRMLPLFTDNRYEHLQIDEELKVRVFSSDKRDFMDLEEVSSGTQRQIMLAVRLALSKKLLSRTVKGKQFAFLDEPFAFFDQERTRRALHALADLGDDISQVWIVTQDFPDNCEVEFDTTIYCERGIDTLKVVA